MTKIAEKHQDISMLTYQITVEWDGNILHYEVFIFYVKQQLLELMGDLTFLVCSRPNSQLVAWKQNLGLCQTLPYNTTIKKWVVISNLQRSVKILKKEAPIFDNNVLKKWQEGTAETIKRILGNCLPSTWVTHINHSSDEAPRCKYSFGSL